MHVLEFMLAELEGNRLEVCKIPTRRVSDSSGYEECGYIRIAVSANAEWYQNFCGSFMGSRARYSKPRTIIKRINTTLALRRMIDRGDRTTEYATRLLRAAQEVYEAYGTPHEHAARSSRYGRRHDRATAAPV